MDRNELAWRVANVCAEVVADANTITRRAIRGQYVAYPTSKEVPRRGHAGDPTRHLDVVVDRSMQSRFVALVSALPVPDHEVVYNSEESQAPYGDQESPILGWADPVDGTTNAYTLTSGYANVMFADHYEPGEAEGGEPRLRHLGGAIATSHGEVVKWFVSGSSGVVTIDWRDDSIAPTSVGGPLSTVQVRDGVERRVAAVATSYARRRRLAETFDFDTPDPYWVANGAGNPLIVPLLVGELGAVIETETVAIHDAAFLIPLVLAGGHVVSLDGEPMNPILTAAEFQREDRVLSDGYIASASKSHIEALLARRRR